MTNSTNNNLFGMHGWAKVALMCGAAMLAASAGGCRGERTDAPPRQLLPDMDDSPKNKPQSQTEFFADGRSMRPRVKGTVAFGETTDPEAVDRVWRLADDPAMFEGVDVSVDPAKNNNELGYVATIPARVLDLVIAEQGERQVTMDRAGAMDWMVKRGHERFNIYCSACHGYNGEGGGTMSDGQGYGGLVGRRWSAPVPNFHDAKYLDRAQKTGKDGYVFNVIRHGVPAANPGDPPKMPSYADKVNTRDSWAIVAYLRVLQASWTAPSGASASAETGQSSNTGNQLADAANDAQQTSEVRK